MKGGRKAWVTTVVDQKTAVEAIVLAKSLSRAITIADTIAVTSQDIPIHIRKALSHYFDVVILENISDEKKTLPKEDQLKLTAWNLGMYSKCVVLSSKTMILRNCDEIFDTEDDISVVSLDSQRNSLEASVIAMKPCVDTYLQLSKLTSNGHTFKSLTEFLNKFFKSPTFSIGTLSPICNFNIAQTNQPNLSEMKIISFGKDDLLNTIEDNCEKEDTIQEIYNIWKSLYNDIQGDIRSELQLSPNNIKELYSMKKHYKNAIAVVGYSCRFPGANNSDEFWELIKNGGDGICQVPPERLFDYQRHDPRFTESKAGFLKCPIDEFDAKFFGISPREAAYMDPQQRLLVEVAWEALEDSAINPHSLKGSNTGVFTGVWTHDYERLITENTSGQDFHHVVLGNAFSATSSRVSYFLGLNGPNIATESGCSSSMVALHLACESLRKRETDLGLVLGANIIILQFPLAEIPILAPDGHCKTYDEKADGFGRAEGVAVLVLKRLSDAVKNNDRIMGIIRGSALSNEGTTSSFGTPSKICQEIAVRKALEDACVKPSEVDYVEAHGTGTPVGDPIEFAALSAGYQGRRENPLIVGSVKTNIGHTESAAGLAGVIKVLLSMKHEMIPPHRNFGSLNPNINLDSVPAVIPLEAMEWRRTADRVRIAGVSSFGISGTNVHAIIEEPPEGGPSYSNKSDRSHHILTLSAKSDNALNQLISKYGEFFLENSNLDIGNFAFTANTGRAPLRHRVAVTGKSIKELKSKLSQIESVPSTLQPGKGRIGFLFTGQGSQYLGMAKDLYKSNAIFRSAFRECAKIVENNANISLVNVLFNEGQGSLLGQTIYSQLSIFAVEYSLLKLWESLGIKPDFVLGHSVGEFAAATAAGILNLQDALLLLAERSRLIQSLPHGGMLAIRTSQKQVSRLMGEFLGNNLHCNAWLDIAVINSPEDVVVAGNQDTLELFQQYCNEKGEKSQFLAASHPFHSRGVDAILKEFGIFAGKIKYKSPRCMYISGTTGKCLVEGEMGAKYWQSHVRETVKFSDGIATLAEYGCNIFIELGPHPVLLALGLANLPTLENTLWLPSLRRNEDNWKTLLESVGTLFTNYVEIKWKTLDESMHREKIELPFYPFERQKHWIEVTGEGFTKPLHPLLGRRVVLADTKDLIYEHTWSLKDLPYLVDHQVAHTIILPGAGFLEIILAAGRDCLSNSVEYSDSVLKVEDFVVESPLELTEDKKCKIQVVASPIENQEGKWFIRIYMYQKLNGYNEEKGWRQYSSACVGLECDIASKYSCGGIEIIKSRCPNEKPCGEFYKLAPEIGISFGDTFQSVETVWEGSNEILAKIPLPSKAGNMDDYIYHPIILDAMIQSFGLSIGKKDVDLYLPVGVGKFIMCNNSFEDFCFAHAKWESGATSGSVSLYSKNSVLLAVMENVRLLRTSVSSFLNVINGQKNMLPGLFHEIWRARDGPTLSRMDLAQELDFHEVKKDLFRSMEEPMKNVDPEILRMGDELVSIWIMEMFLKNEFVPELGQIYNHLSLMQQNLLASSNNLFFFRLIEILSEDGYFIPVKTGEFEISNDWKLVRKFPSLEELASREVFLKERIAARGSEKHVIIEIAQKCKPKMWGILQGKESAVAALFGSEDLNLLDLYNKSAEDTSANIRISKFFEIALDELKPGKRMSGSIVRIIEIGAGSASTSRQVIRILQNAGIAFRYTFTDISPVFLEAAKKEFANVSGVDYNILDIEKSPSCQGFCPYYYDFVIAANVIHATEYLRTSVKNIRSLLRPNGMLLLKEMLEPKRLVDFIFGLLPDYMNFKDLDIRKTHPTVSKDVWDKVFLENGFIPSAEISEGSELSALLVTKATVDNNSRISPKIGGKQKIWIIFSEFGPQYPNLYNKIKSCGEDVVQIKSLAQPLSAEMSTIYSCLENYEQFKETLDALHEKYTISGVIYLASVKYTKIQQKQMHLQVLNLCKYFSCSTNTGNRIFIFTRGVHYISNNQTNVYPGHATLLGMLKSLKNEMPNLLGKLVDLDPDSVDIISESDEIFYELFDEEETIVSYRNGKRFVNRFTKLPKLEAPLVLPPDRYTVDIPKSKKIRDLKFSPLEKRPLGEDEVEVIVKAFALNFRDIFVILKPDTYSSLFEAIGTDFAGIISSVGSRVLKYKVGDEVFGISHNSSAASHVVVNSNMVLHKPKTLTFADASTIPSVFLTAYLCLINVANLKKSENVLIHVASGGVGLIAIQIAKHIGANIIATAGSHRKRSYLKSLGINHVFNSRDVSYGDEIEKLGLKVDVVLNSLTGHGFKETTLRVCNSGARFIEIGKVNIWQVEDVEKLRPDVHYTIVDLEKVNQGDMLTLMNAMKDLFDTQVCTPLPYTRFEVHCIRDALNYFLKAQHIGKIVIGNPEIKNSGGRNFTNDLIFNRNATYLITGGLGGIGLEVAQWMTNCGARNIVLVGRTAPSEHALQILNKMKVKGCRVLSLQVDVGNWEQCKNLFARIEADSQFPPLRGVIHSAGTISDAIYKNQTWEKFETVFNAKVQGGWNLHHLTQNMNLEHFVLFSSIAAIFGPIAQSNHAAANMFLDSLAFYRHSIGLPAQAINWGAWSEVGAATNTVYGKDGAFGIKPFTPNQGIASLKFAMTRPNLLKLAIIQLDIIEHIRHFPVKGNVLSELINETESTTSDSASLQSKTFWDEIYHLSLEQRSLNIKTRLETIIRKTLKLPDSENVDEFQTFSEMGLDSLMAVELRNKLQNIMGKNVNLNANSLLDHPNINGLSKYLAEITMGVTNSENIEGNSKNTDLSAVYQLVKQDSVLPVEIQSAGPAPNSTDIKIVLLTGATGRFGVYLLRDLVKTPVSQIYCLIRSKNAQQGRKKLMANLKKFNFDKEVDLTKVSIIVGNIAENHLGIHEGEYVELSNKVDCVYHLAAKANHVEEYRLAKSKVDIRAVNVVGTLNILRFAANLKTKRVIFTSTFATVNRLTSDGFAAENFPEGENFADGISMGYVISKFVCEKLLAEANNRGIPCTVIRYPTLIGDSVTGHFSVDSDTFLNLFFLSTRLGLVPDLAGGFHCLPVDVASLLTVEIGFSDHAQKKLFNLFQPVGVYSKDFIALAQRQGRNVTLVSDKEFSERLQRESEHNSWLSLLTSAYGSDFMAMVRDSSLITELSLKSQKSVYQLSENLQNVIPDVASRIPKIVDIIHVYADFANRSGLLQKMGLTELSA